MLNIRNTQIIEDAARVRDASSKRRREEISSVKAIGLADYTPKAYAAKLAGEKEGNVCVRGTSKNDKDLPYIKKRKTLGLSAVAAMYLISAVAVIASIAIGKSVSLGDILLLVPVELLASVPFWLIYKVIISTGKKPADIFLNHLPAKVVKLKDGRVMVVCYSDDNEKDGLFNSYLDDNDEKTVNPTGFNWKDAPVVSAYEIEKYISSTMTEDGLQIESAGTLYGFVRVEGRNLTRGQAGAYESWAEKKLAYRRDLVPVTYDGLEDLNRMLDSFK